MNTTDKKFEEQDHPLKNTDQAFVQVGKNGEPVIPQTNENKTGDATDDENTSNTETR